MKAANAPTCVNHGPGSGPVEAVIDRVRHRDPLGRLGKHRQQRDQLVAALHRMEIDDASRLERRSQARELGDLFRQCQGQTEQDHDRRDRKPEALDT